MARHEILVVDDEKSMTEFFEGFFSEMGYQMEVAANGEEALKIVEQRQPALILLDMQMPGVNGVQVLKTIKERYPKVKIVVMTSYDEKYKQAADQYHADAFFAKPIGLAELCRKVAGLLQQGGSAEQTTAAEDDEDLVPKAKLMLVGEGSPLLTSWGIDFAIHTIGEGRILTGDVTDYFNIDTFNVNKESDKSDEDKFNEDYPDAGLYDFRAVGTRKEAMEKLGEEGADFEVQCAKINRLLWGKCRKYGLMAKRPAPKSKS